LETDLKRRVEGERVKYRMNGNSAKFYDKAYCVLGNALRGAETTINTVKDFRVYRPAEGGPEDDLRWRRLRKGVADLHRRTEISQKINDRLLNALAAVDDGRSVEELTAQIQRPAMGNGRRARARPSPPRYGRTRVSVGQRPAGSQPREVQGHQSWRADACGPCGSGCPLVGVPDRGFAPGLGPQACRRHPLRARAKWSMRSFRTRTEPDLFRSLAS
jgi:hypothetical protein